MRAGTAAYPLIHDELNLDGNPSVERVPTCR
jgi:hypothetical protein